MTLSHARPMNCRICLGIAALVLIAMPVAHAADKPVAAAGASPTTDDIEQALDKKDYANAVKMASKLLALHGNAAAGLNRYELFTLKGEGHLGLKVIPAAIEAYQYAIKETTDPHEIAVCKSTILLFRGAKGTTYTPKTTPPGGTKPPPIDLLDRTQRKIAFAALLDDEMSLLLPKIKSASTSQSLTVIFPVLQQVEDLTLLDRLANDNDDKTTQIAGDLVEHARTLITTALKGMWQRVDDIQQAADKKTTLVTQIPVNTTGQYVTRTTVRKAGLTQQNKSELSDIISTCDKIQPAATAFMQSAGKNANDWAAITSDATRVGGRAKDVVNADYSDQYPSDTPAMVTPQQYPTQPNGPVQRYPSGVAK